MFLTKPLTLVREEITVDDSQEGKSVCAVKPTSENMTEHLVFWPSGTCCYCYVPRADLAHPLRISDLWPFIAGERLISVWTNKKREDFYCAKTVMMKIQLIPVSLIKRVLAIKKNCHLYSFCKKKRDFFIVCFWRQLNFSDLRGIFGSNLRGGRLNISWEMYSEREADAQRGLRLWVWSQTHCKLHIPDNVCVCGCACVCVHVCD